MDMAENRSRMTAIYSTPILYLNMGGEMLYVLQQRLQSQRISADKTIIVINEVIAALLHPKQLEGIFYVGTMITMPTLRPILETVVLSSIMKLDGNSMNKLFDLMIMMVKYQLETVTGPRELILSTLNHIDALREMATDQQCIDYVDSAYKMIMDTYGKMTYKEVWHIRADCLQEIQERQVRVSVLMRLGLQNPQDASFNRLVQRYDEQYKERREVLENVKIIDYVDDEGIMGSLSIYGDRATVLGKNAYSSCYGRVRSTKMCGNFQLPVPMSNRYMRRELEALATQLGKEEAMPMRPFSLRLYSQDGNEADHDGNCMECSDTPDNSKLHHDSQTNVEDNNNEPISEYKKTLVAKVASDFPDNDKDFSDDDLLDLIESM